MSGQANILVSANVASKTEHPLAIGSLAALRTFAVPACRALSDVSQTTGVEDMKFQRRDCPK